MPNRPEVVMLWHLLKPESDKLLELSADLRKQINNSSPDRLSVDSLKEAAEIEKLAHNLHQQLKD